MRKETPDYSLARLDPTAVFDKPEEVLAADFSDQQKIDILKRWHYDVLELMVAAEENMVGDDDMSQRNLLQRILNCLHELGAHWDNDSGTTKHGGHS